MISLFLLTGNSALRCWKRERIVGLDPPDEPDFGEFRGTVMVLAADRKQARVLLQYIAA